MPVGARLIHLGRCDHCIIAQHLAEELNSDWQAALVNPQGTLCAGKPHKLPMPPIGSAKDKPVSRLVSRVEAPIGCEGAISTSNCCEDHVHLLLENAANALCPDEVLRGHGLRCVASDAAQGIAELCHVSGFDQLREGGSCFNVDHDAAGRLEWSLGQLNAADRRSRILQDARPPARMPRQHRDRAFPRLSRSARCATASSEGCS